MGLLRYTLLTAVPCESCLLLDVDMLEYALSLDFSHHTCNHSHCNVHSAILLHLGSLKKRSVRKVQNSSTLSFTDSLTMAVGSQHGLSDVMSCLSLCGKSLL